MRQILTIFWDSYRLLKAKKLFWVALGFSVLIALVYASIGYEGRSFSIFFGALSFDIFEFEIPDIMAKFLYLRIFTHVLVPFWLGLLAIVLALISVCSVFPNFLQSGSIDVAVSKPISRVTLFFSKYVSSLFFVAIQVTVFCVIVFLAFGVRMDSWNLGIFWAVPLIVLVFSLIYSVAVLTAVWTRSTLLSLLMALVMWGASWGMQVLESFVYQAAYTAPAMGFAMDDMPEDPSEITEIEKQEPIDQWVLWHGRIKAAGAPLPKTRDATYLLKTMIKIDGHDLTKRNIFMPSDDDFTKLKNEATGDLEGRHSTAYVIGTSLAFEAVILSLACFVFVRKDY